MMLRSSSTPVLGSLLPSYHESPNNKKHSETNAIKPRFSPISFHPRSRKPPYHHRQSLHGSLNPISSSHPPISPSFSASEGGGSRNNGVRRAQSEGNLEGLLASCVSCDGYDELDSFAPPKKLNSKPIFPAMQTIPSFSFHHSGHRLVDEEEYTDGDEEESNRKEVVEDRNGESSASAKQADDVKLRMENGTALANVSRQVVDFPCEEDNTKAISKMHIAMGLTTDDMGGCCGGGGSGGGGECKITAYNGDGDGGGPQDGVEEYYKRMVEENPRNPLFLRNYAQFLYQSKEDLQGAEEYYARAILEDPTDGEILCKYAKLIWELHRDQPRAESYFERAVHASPEDSHVHATYACFLWEIEEEEEVQKVHLTEKDVERMDPFLYVGSVRG